MSRRLLIIDDDPAVVAFLTEELSAYFEVGGEVSSIVALARARSEHFDLVIADVEMPELRGPDLLRALLADKPAQRVLMITAFGSASLAVELMRAGATHVLGKPFSIATLRAAINTSSARDPVHPSGAPAPR